LSQITAIETSYYAGYLDCSVQKKLVRKKLFLSFWRVSTPKTPPGYGVVGVIKLPVVIA